MNKANPIYVETNIRTSMEDLWTYTQDPKIHEQWDLRFTKIEYIPKETENEPQRFRYETRIGMGLKIKGKGESVGTVEKDGERSSSLKFWSNHPLSLIKEGSGYWKYISQREGIRFLTLYHYDTRFGAFGRIVDRLMFRPLMGKATAWSFDALRVWLEKGIHPSVSLRRCVIQWLIGFVLGFIWMYQGLIPKLVFPNSGELELLQGLNLFAGREKPMLLLVGFGEVLFGLLFFFFGTRRSIHLWNIGVLILLSLGAFISQAYVYVEPFNPLAINLSMIVLSAVAWLNRKDLPEAGNCIRKRYP